MMMLITPAITGKTVGLRFPAPPVDTAIELEAEDGDTDDVGDPEEVGEPNVVDNALLDLEVLDVAVIKYISPEASDDTNMRPLASIAIPTGRKQLPGH